MQGNPRPPRPFELYLPPSRKDDSRQRARRLAKGLTLSCTRVASSRLHQGALRNIAVEIRDIGPGGVGFVSSEPLPVPCHLNLHLRQDDTGVGLHARGEIAWSRTLKIGGREQYVVGVRFDEILSPPESQAILFTDRDGGPEQTAQQKRLGHRFAPSDCEVTLERDHRFREGKQTPGNLAIRLLDVSRAGAQVAVTEPLKKGDRVRITLNLMNFQDIFTAEAEAVWARPGRPMGGSAWSVGLSFGSLSMAQERKLQALETWFAGSRRNEPPAPPRA